MTKSNIVTLYNKQKRLQKQLSNVSKELMKFDLLDYVFAHTTVIDKPKDYDRWSDVRFFIKLHRDGHNFDAWRADLDMPYAKKLYFDNDYTVRVFDNGIDDLLAITYISCSNDNISVRINSIDDKFIYCTYTFTEISTVTGEELNSYSGDIRLTLQSVIEYFIKCNPRRSAVINIRDAKFRNVAQI